MNLKMMRMNIFQANGNCVSLELNIPPEMAALLQSSKVTNTEFLIYDKVSVPVPDLSKLQQGKLDKFSLEKGG